MRFHSLYLAIAVVAATPAFADGVLQQAEALINLQRASQAYDLLAPLEDDRAGQPQYDYLLGLSLLEMGEAHTAIFAFERCLSVEPKNGPCRVQMARSHLALGETPNARAELATISEYNPPPEVQQLVARYLGAINTLEQQQQRRISAYALAGLGYDSNINSAPDDANKVASALPSAFGNKGSSIPTSNDSAYANLAAGASLVYKVSTNVVTMADINMQARTVDADHNLDYQAVDSNLGGSFNLETFQLVTKLQGQKMWLDGKSYRDLTGGLLQIQGTVGDGQMALFTQLSQMRYDTQSARDANRQNTGIAYSQAVDTHYSPSFYVSIYGGSEAVTDKTFERFSQSFKGLRLGGGLSLTTNLSLNTQLSYETRDYNKDSYYAGITLPGASFPTVYRDDKESSIGINANWRINKQISFIPSYTYANNNSNIPFSDYNRHVVSVDLRFDM
ncbi:MAG: tetratricopeptide repeat protein [Agitococcus sp.]|nr:tetratricopeptide repeat protein [Agitococcus sp.]MDO9176763.1 tetratricopeptide repeat protein [Agitococcus sp.]